MSQLVNFSPFQEIPPHRETVLEPGELITFVTLPPTSAGDKSVYLKLRDRASYEFAKTLLGSSPQAGDADCLTVYRRRTWPQNKPNRLR
jgi:hypothetical protein